MLCYTAAEECGGNYIQNSGTIDYPLGNSSYGNNEYCVWSIQLLNSTKRMIVNVTHLDLGFYCNDYLEASIYIPVFLIRTIK